MLGTSVQLRNTDDDKIVASISPKGTVLTITFDGGRTLLLSHLHLSVTDGLKDALRSLVRQWDQEDESADRDARRCYVYPDGTVTVTDQSADREEG